MNRPQPSQGKETLHALIDRGIGALLEQLRQGRSARLEQYLEFAGRFHRYSLRNQWAILWQCPCASHVASYRAWAAMGYQVARGARAIWIWAPRTTVRRDELDDDESVVSFVAVPVFDASQLTGAQPLPQFFTPLPDDQAPLVDALVEVVTSHGIAVGAVDDAGAAQGYSAGKRIGLRRGLDSTSQFLVLLHEYSHELLHQGTDAHRREPSLRVRECHAEAVCYVVAHRFGIHNPFSSDYLQSWGNTAADLTAALEVVRRTSTTIIEQLECQLGRPAAVESAVVNEMHDLSRGRQRWRATDPGTAERPSGDRGGVIGRPPQTQGQFMSRGAHRRDWLTREATHDRREPIQPFFRRRA